MIGLNSELNHKLTQLVNHYRLGKVLYPLLPVSFKISRIALILEFANLTQDSSCLAKTILYFIHHVINHLA